MLGTYALSAGYYDAYYGKALKVRTLILRDFAAAYEQFDLLLSPTSPCEAFRLGDKTADPLTMYLNDVCTIPSNLSGQPAMSVPVRHRRRRPARSASRCSRPTLGEPTMFRAAAVLEGGCPVNATDADWETVDRPRGARRAGDRHQDVLRVPEPVRRRAQHQRLPGVPRPARLAAGGERDRPSSWPAALGLALGCEVEPSVFARKNYFYPDMPKDYQVTPVRPAHQRATASSTCRRAPASGSPGPTSRRTRASPPTWATAAASTAPSHSLIDYNRAGVPLLEIVSEPDIRSAEEAREYVSELRSIILAVGRVGRQDGGGLDAGRRQRLGAPPRRAVRHPLPRSRTSTRCGRSAGPSSTRSARQIDLVEAGEAIVQETRHWDEEAGRTRPGRRKEDGDDYRYFQEPDLVPLVPDAAWLDGLRAAIPALPASRRAALAAAAGVEPTDAAVALLVQRDQDALALAAIGAVGPGGDAARVLTHVEHDIPADATATFAPDALAGVVALEGERKLTATQAKKVLEVIAERGGAADPAAVAAELGFEAMDTGELEGPRRRGHRRQRRRLGQGAGGQREGGGRHHRPRHAGHQGQGRRQGRGRAPRRPQGRRLTPPA